MKAPICGAAVLALNLLGWPVPTLAQTIVRGTERITSDRPEDWAVRYFTSTTLLGGFMVPQRLDAGSMLIGSELVWIPYLTTEQQRVGFRGTKLEDLNQAPVFARPRITIGLPASFAATVAFVPPIETFGVKPQLVGLALERPFYESDRWMIGWRAYGQLGTVRAAVTCPEAAVPFAAGSPQNPAGCLEPSSDLATLRYAGLEISTGDVTAGRRVTPHLGGAVNYFDNTFETNARRFDFHDGTGRTEFIDRTIQRSDGLTFSVTAGVGLHLTDRLDGAIDVFYAPLWVVRRAGAPRENDGLVNAKALVRYRIR